MMTGENLVSCLKYNVREFYH